jgi:hypothetical protein
MGSSSLGVCGLLRLMEIRWEVFFGFFFGVANGNWGFFGADFFFGVKGKPPATGD